MTTRHEVSGADRRAVIAIGVVAVGSETAHLQRPAGRNKSPEDHWAQVSSASYGGLQPPPVQSLPAGADQTPQDEPRSILRCASAVHAPRSRMRSTPHSTLERTRPCRCRPACAIRASSNPRPALWPTLDAARNSRLPYFDGASPRGRLRTLDPAAARLPRGRLVASATTHALATPHLRLPTSFDRILLGPRSLPAECTTTAPPCLPPRD